MSVPTAPSEIGSPVCAGIDPTDGKLLRPAGRFPRVCGDRPEGAMFYVLPKGVPPCVRG